MPMSMFTQLEKLDFTGKLVKVFTTHEGSGLGNVVSDVKKICKGANVLDSLAIHIGTGNFSVSSSVFLD